MNLRNSLFYAAGFGVFIALASTASHAILYKWIDENGRVAYGDQPPPGAKPEKLNTSSIGPADPNAVRDMASKDAEIKKRQQQRADEAAKTAKDESDGKKKLDQCAAGARQDQDPAQRRGGIQIQRKRRERCSTRRRIANAPSPTIRN